MIKSCSLLTFAIAASLPQVSAQNILALSSDSAYRVSSLTGAGTALGQTGFDNLHSLTKLGNTYVAVSNGYGLLDVDATTGAGTLLSVVTPAYVRLASLAADPSTGLLYGLDTDNPQNLHIVDPGTGATTLVGPTGFVNSILRCFAIDANGAAFAWHYPLSGASLGLMRVDLATGSASDVDPLVGDGASRPWHMAFAGETLFGKGSHYMTIDTATGESQFHSNGISSEGGFVFTSNESVVARGTGCPGSLWTPGIAATSLPTLGTTMNVITPNVSQFPIAIMAVGLSGTNATFGALPYSLQPLGLGANCRLWTSAELLLSFPVQVGGPAMGGVGSFDLAIPNVPGVSGAQLFLQAISIDAGVPGGMALTRSLVATIH